MTSQLNEMPADLLELFPDDAPRTLAVPLPPGQTVRGSEGVDDRPVLWMSEEPAPAGLWSRLHAVHQDSGLWPVLLDGLGGDMSRPWTDGELWPAASTPDQHDVEGVLTDRWAALTDDDSPPPADEDSLTAPYGRTWPGLAPELPSRVGVRQHADHWAEQLSQAQPEMRLGLVAAPRGSDVLATLGWHGAINHIGVAELCAVLRSWEDRFGVRVIGVGFAELYLSVAAPPSNLDEALPIAAEHFAFCPDNILQGQRPYTLAAYAERLVDAPTWAFWWD
ncbi:DUF4253 domain-containing protein [Micromonospora sp. NPDC048871]|uniref:DUF4253 domain-containing protein n=1 Tax=unclassified Micromonospora TaxID=2617518 RepID=UPI002E126AFB|nr:DUF4253 domain-containing protein [Micromonospora sp. NBC_01739]